MGKILLKGMEFQAYHGYYAEEADVGHVFIVDIEIKYNLEEAAVNDDLSQTIDYQTAYKLVAKEMKKPSKLIEHLAYRIKTRLTDSFPGIGKMKISISKLNPPVGGKIHSATVVY